MKIDIAKEDLWWLRSVIDHAVRDMEGCPNPSAYAKAPQVGRRVNRKLSRALKKVHGHDCHAEGHVA